MNSFLLNNVLNGQSLKLDSKESGLIKIRKVSNTDEVVLDVDDSFQKVGNNHCNSLDLLSYFLDIPINVEKRLTYDGNYIPTNFVVKRNLINCTDIFCIAKFDEYFVKLNKMCSPQNKNLYKKGKKIVDILHIYHNAQKMFPEFYEESFINFVRILDSITNSGNAIEWSDKIVKKVGKKFILENFNNIDKKYYKEHVYYAKKLFFGKKKGPKDKSFYDNEDKKIFYSMLWCIYEYRNKWIHNGFPIPHKVKESLKNFNILGVSMGESDILDYEKSIFLDIHNRLPAKTKRGPRNYKKYYLLLPSWYFLNKITKHLIDKELMRVRL